MLYLGGVVGFALLALWVFCLVDVILTPEGECRNLPKLAWLLIVLILPDVGSIIWLIAGRPRSTQPRFSGHYAGARPSGFPEYERPGRATASTPEADAEFLAQCRARAEEQRAAARRRDAEPGAD
ncbi:MAG: PLD nuclease N-terminal domain-containing protein [Nakamurella sp.]